MDRKEVEERKRVQGGRRKWYRREGREKRSIRKRRGEGEEEVKCSRGREGREIRR